MLFKVAAVSSNTNAFGLRHHVFIARTGQAFCGAGSHNNQIAKGTVITLEDADPASSLIRRGFELVERCLPDAPPALVAEVWD